MVPMRATEPDAEQVADEPASAIRSLGLEAEQAVNSEAVRSLGEIAFRLSSPVIDAIEAETERRAAWAEQVCAPLGEISEAARRPLADAAAAAEMQLESLQSTLARAAAIAQSQQDQINDVLRDTPALDVTLPHLDVAPAITPSSSLSLGNVLEENHAATAERREQDLAHQATVIDLLKGMLERQDEILRRQDAQLGITRQTARGHYSAHIASHVAAGGAVGAALVVVAPTPLLQLLVLPAIALVYAAVLLIIGRRPR
jgi:hypothetical protein